MTRAQRPPLEVEAKLLATRERHLRAIACLDSIGPYRLRGRDAVRLHSAYVDTEDLALVRRGIALRLRRHGSQWELTAKWGGRVAGLVHARPELTVTLPRAPRYPFHLQAPLHPVIDRLVTDRGLSPILITRIHRRRIDVLPAAGKARSQPLAELALDRVRLYRPTQRTAADTYFEVEIERLHGTRRDVIRLAELLRRRFALSPSKDSKFARGLAVLYGANVIARVRRAQ
ncbi:MAG: adenylate cyclase [Deltaproteobacteria bacterium]|nr:adenylate cyclase [Deltaproteobacteria bacterium]